MADIKVGLRRSLNTPRDRRLAAAEAALHSPGDDETRKPLRIIFDLIEAAAATIRPSPPRPAPHE